MNRQLIGDLARDLRHRRSLLLQDAAESQGEMKAILEQQESEFEESAQKDRITRLINHLKERDRQKIKEIDAALTRMAAGNYGKCQKCGREIGIGRLRALPATTLCINCAAARESKERAASAEEPSERLPMRRSGRMRYHPQHTPQMTSISPYEEQEVVAHGMYQRNSSMSWAWRRDV